MANKHPSSRTSGSCRLGRVYRGFNASVLLSMTRLLKVELVQILKIWHRSTSELRQSVFCKPSEVATMSCFWGNEATPLYISPTD